MNENYGALVNVNSHLMRKYFDEMVHLLGVNVKYMSPLKSGDYTTQGEFKAINYSIPITVGCIFEEHETQQTAKKCGWLAELNENASVIHVPYDLEGLQIGCLFEVPSAFDNAGPRLFRVTKMSAIMIYPASITCEIVPEYRDTMPPDELEMFHNSNFNVLNEG